MVCWSRYLRHNPESYEILAALSNIPQGLTFSDIRVLCDLQSPRLRSLLMHMQQYDLVELQQTGWKTAPLWKLRAKSYAAVSSTLEKRVVVTVQNCSSGVA